MQNAPTSRRAAAALAPLTMQGPAPAHHAASCVHGRQRIIRVASPSTDENRAGARAFEEATCVRCVEENGALWQLFDARDVPRFFAQDKYTCFMWDWPQGKSEQLLAESLRALEARLEGHGFVRVHRRELVNLRFVRHVRLIGGPDGARAELVLHDGERVMASRRGTRMLKQRLLRLGERRRPAAGRPAAHRAQAAG